MPSGFHLLIAAQFVSALADNALLIVAIALLAEQGLPGWWAPMLKFGFTLSYVVLALFVGVLADAVPKARLMAWMNAVKLAGAALMLGGVHPIAGFALVGLGAAAYAPAKYGLVTELVPARSSSRPTAGSRCRWCARPCWARCSEASWSARRWWRPCRRSSRWRR